MAAAKALADADFVVGSPRLLEAMGVTGRPADARKGTRTPHPATLALGAGGASLADALDAVANVPGRAVVLASGDPGFFGVVRALAERFGPDALEVHPAPSSVSLAFARLGLPWDDALIVSTLARP
ncbi:MAG: cobalt-precorrin-7 (C(5))-methyltransferase, partial [Actinomycetota bacterium]|nr:cobalt-precorrin-7 (C(5))-methyltransferase [Actinomycetota bacterium]